MQRQDIAFGTCDGTDAAINVVLGWQPRRVVVRNIENAAQQIVTWQKGMELVSASAAGLLDTGIDDTDYDRTVLAATYGISMYAGGDEIHWCTTHSRWENAAAVAVSEVYVDGHYQQASGGAAYKNYGDCVDPNRTGAKVLTGEGFTIAAGCVANNDGEQLIWQAFR
jgi:hypothetical protein